MKRARWLLFSFFLLAGLAGSLAVAARCYLTSADAARRVAGRLEGMLGTPVRVHEVDLGLTRQSSVRGLELFGSPTDTAPWLAIDDLSADVSAWELLGGKLPRQIEATGAALALDFDSSSQLVPHLPARGLVPRKRRGRSLPRNLPTIHVRQGRVTLRQAGRPDLLVTGVEATLCPENGRLVLTGTVADPDWGPWALDGQIDLSTGVVEGKLETKHIHLTRAHLAGLPFVPEEVWQQVQLEGDTSVSLRLRLDGKGAVGYHVALEPTHTRVHVSAIDLDADQASGKVIVCDGVVQLQDVRGRTAEGAIRTTGHLDFRASPSLLNFAIGVEGVQLQRLPEKWAIPRLIHGRLTGQADLAVTITNGEARTTGQGKGEVTLRGLEGHPLRIKLHADGDGFRFTAQGQDTKATSRPGDRVTGFLRGLSGE
jgi:hypothetical protein